MRPPYDLTLDMTYGFPETAAEAFRGVLGRQPIRYLEVGVYEGRSGLWVLDDLLTHSESTYTGIDLVTGHEEAHARAVRNFAPHVEAGRAELVVGDSKEVLRGWAGLRMFDAAYIDGCHSEAGCYGDLTGLWPLLTDGAVVLCDDYDRPDYGVKAAVHRFFSERESSLEVLGRGYRIAFRKGRG